MSEGNSESLAVPLIDTDEPQNQEHLQNLCQAQQAQIDGLKQMLAAEITRRQQAEAALTQRNLEFDLFHRASQAFNSTLDLGQVLGAVLKEMQRLLDVTAASFWIIVPETGELVCRQAIGPGSEKLPGWRLAPGQGLAGWAAQTGESLIVADTAADPRHFKAVDRKLNLPLRSILSIPMRAKGQVIGVMNLVDTRVGRFSQADLILLEPLVAAAAIAIENARLHAAVQAELVERERAEEALRRLNEELERRVDERTRALQIENSERQRTEIELRQSENRFRRVITSISDHVYMTEITPTGQRINRYISPNVEALTGYPYDLFLADWSFWAMKLIHVEDRSLATVHALNLPLNQAAEIEYRLVRADGRMIWVRDSARIERDGDITVIYGIVSDITERKRIEQEATEIKLIQELSRLRSELVSNVSHELRTPLGLIKAAGTTLLAEDVEFDRETQRMLLHGIDEETVRLEHIVNNLLDLSRMEQQRLHLTRLPTDLSQLSRKVLQGMQISKPDHPRYTFVHQFPGEPLIVSVDSQRIEQVLRNLLTNALKYSPQGGIILIRGRRDQEHLLIAVSDHGIGIAPDEWDKIFERFYRVDNETSRQVGGTGLGLAISRGIIEAHGGRIWVESQPGVGSTFYISLPLHR